MTSQRKGLEFATMDEICDDLEAVCQTMEKLASTFHNGKILHEGLSLCLVGCPNVGKSSLMNALLDKDRAIVSPIPGTTRDILEDHLRLNGLHFKVSDTAGIRETRRTSNWKEFAVPSKPCNKQIWFYWF